MARMIVFGRLAFAVALLSAPLFALPAMAAMTWRDVTRLDLKIQFDGEAAGMTMYRARIGQTDDYRREVQYMYWSKIGAKAWITSSEYIKLVHYLAATTPFEKFADRYFNYLKNKRLEWREDGTYTGPQGSVRFRHLIAGAQSCVIWRFQFGAAMETGYPKGSVINLYCQDDALEESSAREVMLLSGHTQVTAPKAPDDKNPSGWRATLGGTPQRGEDDGAASPPSDAGDASP